jgi:hypothetical protein
MYSGGVLMIFATPLALGSLSAFYARCCCAASSRRGSSTRSSICRGTFGVTRTIAGRFDTD